MCVRERERESKSNDCVNLFLGNTLLVRFIKVGLAGVCELLSKLIVFLRLHQLFNNFLTEEVIVFGN